MMEGCSSKKKGVVPDLTDLVFSWSLEDIFNGKLYKNQVEKIPESFQSVKHYLRSFVFPLLEETRASLASSMDIIYGAPFAEVISLNEREELMYEIKVDSWRNKFSERDGMPYKTLPGDVFIISDAKLEAVSDLQRFGRRWTFASVTSIEDGNKDDSSSYQFKAKTSRDIEFKDGKCESLFVVFLINITTNKRIWKSLHMLRNPRIIKEVLCPNSMGLEDCKLCVHSKSQLTERFGPSLLSKLNESQTNAILASLLRMKCDHKSTAALIWGPPGTGKTSTVSVMLYAVLRMNCRTLICGPTNAAIRVVASKLLKLVRESFEVESTKDALFCSLGDILLFGNKDWLKVDSGIEEIYLDYRVKRLAECLGPLTGWMHCLNSMIDFLEDCLSLYHVYVENETIKETEHNDLKEVGKAEFRSFLDFVRTRFESIVPSLRRCIFIFCTHLPRSFILEHNFQNMVTLVHFLDHLEILLFQDNMVSEELEEIFSHPDDIDDFSESFLDTPSLIYTRCKCLSLLKTLRCSLKDLKLPNAMNDHSISEFCLQKASLIFCTASSSYKLYSVEMEPLTFLVIDEAAQMKECESLVPMQLPGLKHAILAGDECQLPAMVTSNVSLEAGFGRSLFERLSLLGHFKHLLNIQYRMHPSISFFPNSKFYFNKILDAPQVRNRSYIKQFHLGPMFGPYSFINIIGGKEEVDDDGRSRRNMIEVAVAVIMVQKLYRAWNGIRKNLSIGVVSPYAAQVVAIQDKIGRKYEKLDGFTVKVKSIDGFQGGEEDLIIISTVRSNSSGSVGFLSSPQRTNVALTRARHSLLILGNEMTLSSSDSVWAALICDARDRQCFFSVDEDKDMTKAILDVKKDLDLMDDLFNEDSILFNSARWKVLFSDNFKKSFGKLISARQKKSVLNLLLKLSSGWRPKNRNVDSVCESSSQILKQFKVEGLYVVCTIDIVKESTYIQVLKVWDILPLEEIPKLVKRLDSMFTMYTDDFINHCKEKRLEGDLEVPQYWVTSFDILRFKDYGNHEDGNESSGGITDSKVYVENSRVSESFLLMKFYSLSCGVVSHLLSDRDGRELDLPFEVTDQELKIIRFQRSSFILGRSGTGKTTVLTMKLFQREQQHHIASKGLNVAETSTTINISRINDVDECPVETMGSVLRQLFVTVSPKLCYAVKQHVSKLKRFADLGNFSGEDSLIDMDDTEDFKDIPDSFLNIHPNKYPLVITFNKFLMMLDGTVGNSYFERFPGVREHLHFKSRHSRSVALETFTRTKEVNYERFCSLYWPHFSSQLTKELDPSRVFTEIISHIKGGLGVGNVYEVKLSREGYVNLSKGRVSTLTVQQRERIYDIFQDYEKTKMENGEFDLIDLANDLHHRLRNERYEGDKMDFVYIDEVQDLTMKQIALFKYICQNVEEGFVFAGDTAQTIARGIDFRFEDIRSVFYKEFIVESKSDEFSGRNEKGHISEVLSLSENFRTHDGVLRLAQSVINLLYRFFHQSIDVLKPEMSHIYGEAPVLLESGNDENAIVTIFGKSGNGSGSIVGFGAEQVILVRDDCVRKEISDSVEKHALVLTIVECKGLEFQDVLLYNFFGSSPLKNQWRVIYEFMKEQSLLDATLKFPSFNQARHNILCSELKQLYVAITRTRQRLWICEDNDDFSKPMFDYWKKKCLVQVRQLDDSLAQAMQVASSPEEWKARGIKLFHENNYELATVCFERAGDTKWERRSKAAGLKAEANRMRVSYPEGACTALRQAAEIFDSIGMAESAAECFCDLGEYETAGRIYLEKYGETELSKAGECFALASCYELAAKVYARGNYFSECLLACTKGKLFEMGLQYIEFWRRNASRDNDLVKQSKEIDKFEQQFLERCALHYHKQKDSRLMMKFVAAFHSMDSRRQFLKSLNCLDELLLMEEESGNFLEAAAIAKLRGDILLEADLLGKAGDFSQASMLLLWYVFSNSMWASRGKGWPLKDFPQKEEILTKAKSFAKKESDIFCELVCTEINLLSNEQGNLFQLNQYLNASHANESLRAKILSVRRILDIHLRLEISKYEWEDELVVDLIKHSEERISANHISVGTLICFWNLWREKVDNIFKYLDCLKTDDVNECTDYDDFCLSYFGVRRQTNDVNTSYLLLISKAEWVRYIDDRYLRRRGKLVYAKGRHFATAALAHWRSELFSVGWKVLETLESIHKLSIKSSKSIFCRSMPLIYIFEVTKFLQGSKYLDCKKHETQKLSRFLNLSTSYFENVFPLDWRQSLTENMISLRGSELSHNLLEEVIQGNIIRRKLTYGLMGRVTMIWLGSGKPTDELYQMIVKKFDENVSWKEFIMDLGGNIKSEITHGSASANFLEAPREVSYIYKFYRALEDTYNANWMKEVDYTSPSCLLYLLDRLLLLASCSKGLLFTTKSSFVEWVLCEHSNANRVANLVAVMKSPMDGIFDFLARVIKQFLFDGQATAEWIRNSNLYFEYYYPLLLLRLVAMLCLICLNCGKHFDVNFLLGRSDITPLLPPAFIDVFKRMKCSYLKGNVLARVLAEGFIKIGDPLVILRLGENSPSFIHQDAIFVDMRVAQCKEDIMRVLFPTKNKTSHSQNADVEVGRGNNENNNENQGKTCTAPSSSLASMANQKLNNLRMNAALFEEIVDALKSLENVGDGNVLKFVTRASELKAEVENGINFISSALAKSFEKKPCNGGDGTLFAEANCMLDELKQLSSALDVSKKELEKNISTAAELLRRLNLRRPRLESFLNQLLVMHDNNTTSAHGEASETSGGASFEKKAAATASNSKVEEEKEVESGSSEKGKPLQSNYCPSKQHGEEK